MWTWRTVTALAGVLLVAPAAVTAEQPGRAPAAPLVEIDGQALSNDEIERPVALQVYQLETRAHALRRKAVNDAVTRHLLAREAARRGLTLEALLAQEVDAKVTPPTAQEVAAVVAARIKGKPLQGEALEHLRASVETTMKAERRAAQHERYVQSLRSQARIVVNLPDEPALRMTIPTAGEPALGPEDAPVTLVEFGDFQCPFCRTAQRTLKALKERYGDTLRIVHRDFPIDTRHRAARRAAEAARCAGEQNAYWPFHDALYQTQLTGADAELTAIAARLQLDTAALTACLDSKRHVTTVQRGVVDGKALGVSVTPTFFVNGRPLVGAIPLEEFQAAIDRELTRRSAATAERTPKP
jgi:protein-disulfide isomerase